MIFAETGEELIYSTIKVDKDDTYENVISACDMLSEHYNSPSLVWSEEYNQIVYSNKSYDKLIQEKAILSNNAAS